MAASTNLFIGYGFNNNIVMNKHPQNKTCQTKVPEVSEKEEEEELLHKLLNLSTHKLLNLAVHNTRLLNLAAQHKITQSRCAQDYSLSLHKIT